MWKNIVDNSRSSSLTCEWISSNNSYLTYILFAYSAGATRRSQFFDLKPRSDTCWFTSCSINLQIFGTKWDIYSVPLQTDGILAFLNLLGNAGVALGAKTWLRIVGDILLDILYISVARACPLSNVTKHIEVSLNNFRDRVKILPLILSELTWFLPEITRKP